MCVCVCVCYRQYLGSVQLDADCNAGCGCSTLDYNPVCGRDKVMYYSPCYAGCNTTYAADRRVECSSCRLFHM